MNENTTNKALKLIKKHALSAVLCLFGILLLLFGGKANDDAKSDSAEKISYTADDMEAYTERLEEKVKNIISKVGGVDDVTVLLTLDGGNEYVYAENTATGVVDYLIIEGESGEEPVLIREIYAAVRGIAVVCRGGDDAGIQRTLSELLSCAFDIPISKISVAGTDG